MEAEQVMIQWKYSQNDPLSREFLSQHRQQRGYVIILPGIEGYSWLNRRIQRGLIEAEVPYAIEIYDWTHRLPRVFHNLRSRKRHRIQSQAIAEKILAYQKSWPQRPVFLIGHSGGGGMALRTLEQLPLETTISGAILLGAAVSPGFDLRPALAHVDRKIWNMTSWADVFFLGLMTLAAGTLDGRHSLCAGMTGFRCGKLGPLESAKFEEMPYRCAYWRHGHLAGHFGFTAPSFVKHDVAPLLLQQDECCPDVATASSIPGKIIPHPAGP